MSAFSSVLNLSASLPLPPPFLRVRRKETSLLPLQNQVQAPPQMVVAIGVPDASSWLQKASPCRRQPIQGNVPDLALPCGAVNLCHPILPLPCPFSCSCQLFASVSPEQPIMDVKAVGGNKKQPRSLRQVPAQFDSEITLAHCHLKACPNPCSCPACFPFQLFS